MHYSTIHPAPALAAHIRCIWILESREPGHDAQPVFPDGCMELILHYGSPMRKMTSETQGHVQPGNFLAGQLSRHIALQPSGPTGMIGVRFQPWGVFPFLPIALSEITDQDIRLEDIWGKEARELEELVRSSGRQQAVQLIQDFLIKKLQLSANATLPVQQAVSLVKQRHGNIRIQELADGCNLSVRQFNRRFTQVVGLPPKHYAGIVRFQHFFREAALDPQADLGFLAHACGYFDQSHFIREFKAYSGMSPKDYFRDRSGFTSLFLEN